MWVGVQVHIGGAGRVYSKFRIPDPSKAPGWYLVVEGLEFYYHLLKGPQKIKNNNKGVLFLIFWGALKQMVV